MAESSSSASRPPRIVGRYALFDEIASGGMATVHIGRLVGDAGFARTVAIKKLHAQFAKDPEFREMFLDEAHLASRIRHPNVVATLDVVDAEDLLLVMEYVPADSLARLLKIVARRKEHVPLRVAAAIAVQVLHGLHAAHEATSEAGEPLALVHRDVSPQNVLVGTDGVSRVLDFGVAKAIGRMHTTREGVLKGKLAYMSPEQLGGKGIDRRCDVYAASVLFWEMLTATRLFATGDEGETYGKVLRGASSPPSKVAAGVPPELDAIVMRGLAIDPDARFATARDMARAIEASIPMATASEVGEWVESVASDILRRRAERVRQ
ncbi:MAG TPA: serine/threonine-protein kinase, partial [Polyangiaceae bacterium]